MKIIKAPEKDFNEINNLIENEFPYLKKEKTIVSERIIKGNLVFVAKEKNSLFGFIEFQLKEKNAVLLGFAVKKKFRGKGAGKKLFDFFIDFCKKNKTEKIFLIVKKNNFQAKKLYNSRGFIKTGFLEKKIDDSEIEKMELNLAPFKGVN
ncbi:MAG: hypothetical protein COT90_02565 [Candidatus Diapherotrites archaeon CG10_big_fil_rev_8_21_14_0_10_31_34]|nr:MAG: hypothetical protein COT90_02565 [Candidatus Diapherotrites archaeon CG10_big_fil_rev_8_21_14_0_10_31_34]PJA16612.1 MAG: hypothetical protein COX63_03230 [Candidatus Diapherotrites archaeon CG_4_10_14_0_2_um_filter_31_5]